MRKFQMNLILFFMSISLLSVGFAMWKIQVTPDDSILNGDFISDNVTTLDALNSPNFSAELRYNNNGFLSYYEYDSVENELIKKNYDKITYSIIADLPLCANSLSNADAFQIRICLKNNTDYAVKDVLSLIKPSIADLPDGLVVNSSFDEISNEVVINIIVPIEIITTSLKLNVTYDFADIAFADELLKQEFFIEMSKTEDDQSPFTIESSIFAIYNENTTGGN